MSGVAPIISPGWLKSQIDANATNLRILDVSWASANDMQEQYLKENIPTSVYFNIMKGANVTDLLPRNVPEASEFESQARRAGIDADTHIVVYDATGTASGFFIGSRAWWTFKLFGHSKVSVLDGGFAAWKKAGYPVAKGAPNVKKGNFTANVNSHMIKTYEQMSTNLGEKSWQVIDSRPGEKYHGTHDNPKSGHYPGAKNITLGSRLVDTENGRFKSADELKNVFSSAGIDPQKPIVGMCFSGMSSCSVALAGHVLGNTDASIYLGGMTEWAAKRDPQDIERS